MFQARNCFKNHFSNFPTHIPPNIESPSKAPLPTRSPPIFYIGTRPQKSKIFFPGSIHQGIHNIFSRPCPSNVIAIINPAKWSQNGDSAAHESLPAASRTPFLQKKWNLHETQLYVYGLHMGLPPGLPFLQPVAPKSSQNASRECLQKGSPKNIFKKNTRMEPKWGPKWTLKSIKIHPWALLVPKMSPKCLQDPSQTSKMSLQASKMSLQTSKMNPQGPKNWWKSAIVTPLQKTNFWG